MSIDALVLSPFTFILVAFFAIAMGLLASYIKDKVGEGKKGLLELWAELSYFVAVISVMELIAMPWLEGLLPMWSLAPVLLYICAGIALQFIFLAYDARIPKHKVESNGAMIGLLLIWQAVKWPFWIRKAVRS
ncbi:hypothetical protein [Vibrio vulnificus]|uniref:Uncharacterized protein n=1 Tax=Vibrio vulnificus TaxID=672 RepID=A0A2S3R1Z5_VIBVL|nr:hypothetical protein [Vibrio vulnificus]POB47138.1 hypothetical protein CRN52_13750 [Vibrio vulnificus]